MENLLHQVEAIRTTGTFFTANTVDRPLPAVATRDIAAAATGLLLDDSWSGRDTVPLIGPDALAPEGMAQVMTEVLGRPVCARQVNLDAYRSTMTRYGTSGAWVRGLADMAAAQNDGTYDAWHTAPGPTAPTGFRQWCHDVLRPAVGA
ncbi:hypothetical protein [Streptomyces sp. NPDC059564]|uniref:hypothetical protein n=1 Tax=Streptomyces sp. NPDC059564 TaxID=3346865 RepID=UPI0036A04BBB